MMLRSLTTRRLRPALSRPACLPLLLPQSRTFFGLGEVMGVLANPAETLRQLNESKDMLRKAKEDMQLKNEAKKIPRKHTFAKLPGFSGRATERALLRKILSNSPKMTAMFGATSVGKTALLREVLASDDFYVIKFDLRISGFADLRTLYVALCEQFERFFEDMQDEEMDKQKLTFKHLVLELMEKEKAENGGYQVGVADLASLMENLQSCLLAYWEYDPKAGKKGEEEGNEDDAAATTEENSAADRRANATKPGQGGRLTQSDDSDASNSDDTKPNDTEDTPKPPFQKRPIVFLLDEAHKLPALVDSPLSLKVFLDTLLVLTKQDRLCHVIFSTSDPFFHQFLRSMNIGHHAQILTIGDCTRYETESYFRTEILPFIPEHLRAKIVFGEIFDAFGGKLAHVSDYMSAWVNTEGMMTPYRSAIFIQAYTLLHFHLTRSSFETFSPLSNATSGTSTENDDAKFTPADLLYVMGKLVQEPYSLPYFDLCREIGTAQVDSMIKTRILELRWTRSVSAEQDWVERKWSEDGIERPIVLPMTRIIRRAMEVVLREEAENPTRRREDRREKDEYKDKKDEYRDKKDEHWDKHEHKNKYKEKHKDKGKEDRD